MPVHDVSSRVILVVETVTIEGNGKSEPYREVVTYRSLEGVVLAMRDPMNILSVSCKESHDEPRGNAS